MSDESARDTGRLGFLDTLGRLFRSRAEAGAPQPTRASEPAGAHAALEAALRALDQKIEEKRAAAQRAALQRGEARGTTAEERAEASRQRMEEVHRAIREDIEAMHGRLGTGLAGADLDRIAKELAELGADTTPGKDSHELVPRARYAIGEKLRREAGELAIARLVALLRRHEMSWPDPIQHHPGATPEEIERARSRRLRDVREGFLGQDFSRAAACVVGVVPNWRSDYPDRGTPLWDETVLEGVAAAMRGQLLAAFVEVLRRDRDLLLNATEAAIGKELAVLQGVLTEGVASVAQANQVVASSLQAVDEVFTAIAWEHVRSKLPEARGEAGSGARLHDTEPELDRSRGRTTVGSPTRTDE